MGFIERIDYATIEFLNQFVGKSPLFDAVMRELVDATLVKGALFMAIFWGFWLAGGKEAYWRRPALLTSALGAVVIVVISRILQRVMPTHSRPLHTSDLHFQLLSGVTADTLNQWSSFPSDHAALFFALAMGVWYQSRRLGIVSIVWVVLVVCFPRLYLGYHWPTDLVGGAILGIALMALIQRQVGRAPILQHIVQWGDAHRVAFYALAFLATYEIATLFADLRHYASISIKGAQALAAGG